jgi:ornithine cyclodeaminase
MEYQNALRTAGLLPYPELADEIGQVLQDLADKTVQAPERLGVDLGGGNVLLLMPATDPQVTAVKLVSVHGSNPSLNLPTIQGDVIAMKTQTGERIAMWDGSTITGRRTAALSLLAARTLAPEPKGPLLIIGAGTQGRTHLEAFHAGLGTSEVFIVSRSQTKAEALAAHAGSLGIKAQVVANVGDVIGQVCLIVTATTSPTPVVTTALKPNQMLCAVGSFKPQVAELSAQVFEGAMVAVDQIEAAKHEAGDIIQAVAAGRLSWDRVKPILHFLKHPVAGAGPVIFKSVGHAAFDLAAVRLMLRGMGQ